MDSIMQEGTNRQVLKISVYVEKYSYNLLQVKNNSNHHHEYSAQGQVLHCKLSNQGCSSAQRQVFHRKLRNPVLLGMDRCGSFPLLSAPHSLFSI